MSDFQPEVDQIIEQALTDYVFPGAVVGYVTDGKRQVKAYGRLTYEADSAAVSPATLYEAASITKVLPTNTLALMLIDQGKLGLDDLARTYLPDLANDYRDNITIKHLLTYTAAPKLDTNLSAYALCAPEKLLTTLYASPLVAAPGTYYQYNDTAIIWMGLIVERVTGRKLDELAAEWLFEPLGLESTTFHPSRDLTVAPSEINSRGLVQYEVHDESAWTLGNLGVVSGNAGIFTTVDDLLTFAEMLLANGELDGHRYLSPAMVEAMSTNQYPQVTKYAGLGWFTQQDQYFGPDIGPRTFGMTGFTGSMILIDPIAGRAVAMGSNRCYPQRPPDRSAINGVRAALASLIVPA